MKFGRMGKLKTSVQVSDTKEPYGLSSSVTVATAQKKWRRQPEKVLLSMLIDTEYMLCVLQSFDGEQGKIIAVREFEIDFLAEDTPMSVALSALLSEFLGKKQQVDATFVFLGAALTESHEFTAVGMEHKDVLAAIENGTLWPNMVVTSREIDDQAICFELSDLSNVDESGVIVAAIFLDRAILSNITKCFSGLKLNCVSISSLDNAVSGSLLNAAGPDGVALDIRSDGQTRVFINSVSRCIGEEIRFPTNSSKIQPFSPAGRLVAGSDKDFAPHPIWGLARLEAKLPNRVSFGAPSNFDVNTLQGDANQTIKRFESQIDLVLVGGQLKGLSSDRRAAEILYLAEYTHLLSAMGPEATLRKTDLNFLDKSWDIYEADRHKSDLQRSLLRWGGVGAAASWAILTISFSSMPDYRQIALDNEMIKSELSFLDSKIMAIQNEFNTLSLREAAIEKISGNHRDIYKVLITVLRLVPLQVQLSRVAVDAESGDVSIEGAALNEIAVSKFVGLLSGVGRARASLLRIRVNDEGAFSFEISIPYDDLL